MSRTILLALNDVVTRDITAKFFQAQGFICQCVNFDERVIAHVDKFMPHALIAEINLRSRFYSPHDTETAFSLLLAMRFRRPHMPIMLFCGDNEMPKEDNLRSYGIAGCFSYPPDLVRLVDAVRKELRRVARLKTCGSPLLPALNGKRGRPRKYPLPAAPVIAAAV